MTRPMSPTPAQLQRKIVTTLSGLAIGLFILSAGLAGWMLWSKIQLPKTHTAVTAMVDDVRVLCEVQRRVGSGWRVEKIIDCAEAKQIAAADSTAQSVEHEYAKLSYTAGGSAQQKLVRVSELSSGPLAAGSTLAMYADPADPSEIELPVGSSDYASFWTLLAVGALSSLLLAAFGWVVARLNRQRQEQALAAGATVNADGTVSFPERTAKGQPVVLEAAPWSRILGWIGSAVLVAGVTLAVLALLGGHAADRPGSNLLEASILTALSVAIWRICKMIAAFGVRPRNDA